VEGGSSGDKTVHRKSEGKEVSMSKKHPRFRDLWVNQTELGRHFGMSAVAIGKKLQEVRLRTEQKEPSERAKNEGYCRFTPMKDGTPFYLWNKDKVAALLRESGMSQLSEREVEARNTATMLIDLDRQAEETGMDKLLYFAIGEIKQRDYSLINRYLRELGSALRLGDNESSEPTPAPPGVSSEREPQQSGEDSNFNEGLN